MLVVVLEVEGSSWFWGFSEVELKGFVNRSDMGSEEEDDYWVFVGEIGWIEDLYIEMIW